MDHRPDQALISGDLLTRLCHGNDDGHELPPPGWGGEQVPARPRGVAGARQGVLLQAGLTKQQLSQLLGHRRQVTDKLQYLWRHAACHVSAAPCYSLEFRILGETLSKAWRSQ